MSKVDDVMIPIYDNDSYCSLIFLTVVAIATFTTSSLNAKQLYFSRSKRRILHAESAQVRILTLHENTERKIA